MLPPIKLKPKSNQVCCSQGIESPDLRTLSE